MWGYIFIVLLFFFLLFCVVYYMYSGWGLKLGWCGGGVSSWVSPFECGFVGHGLSSNVFSYTFLNLLVIFVIFDLEISLLLNLPFQGVWYDNYLFYLLFMLIICCGYMLEVEGGYVEWSF